MINHEQLFDILNQAMKMHYEGVKVSVALQVYVSAYEEKDNSINVNVSLHEDTS